MDISKSTFLVTGGASGLGGATVRVLAAAGANVVIADLNQEWGEKLAQELGAKARFLKTDVSSEESGRAAVNLAVQTFGGVQGLVNCAGIAVAEKVLGKNGPHALASFTKCITVNLIGTFNMSRLAVEAMAKNPPNAEGERGVIVNTASVAAFDGQIGQPAYSASKAGVVGMTLPMARELASLGIRVLTIAPGIFETPMMGSISETAQKSLGAMVPFPPRLGRPAEFAALCKHIAENVMLNGETIRLDGAIRLAPK